MPTDKLTSEHYDRLESHKFHSWEVPFSFAALCLLATIANAAGAWYVYHFGQAFEAWIAFLIGCIVAQPCLVGVWASLANQSLVKRVFVSGSILIAITCLYIGTLAAIEDTQNGNRKIPTELVIVVGAATIFLYSISAGTLGIYRRISGKSIQRTSEHPELSGQSQFSIKQLFIATTSIAIFIPLIK